MLSCWSRAPREGRHHVQALRVARPCFPGEFSDDENYNDAFLLLEEENNKPKRRKKYHKRRKKLWKFVDGHWQRVHPDKPPEQLGAETVPSDDAKKLSTQLANSKVVRRLLAFLERALTSPAFNVDHVPLVLEVLMEQRSSMKSSEREELKSFQVLSTFAARGQQLLEAEDASSVPAKAIVRSLLIVADHNSDVPQLQPLIKPLTLRAEVLVPDMDRKDIACVVWAIAELQHLFPEMRDRILPKLIEGYRLHYAQVYLEKRKHVEWGYLKRGLMKLCKEVPFLREVLKRTTVRAYAS